MNSLWQFFNAIQGRRAKGEGVVFLESQGGIQCLLSLTYQQHIRTVYTFMMLLVLISPLTAQINQTQLSTMHSPFRIQVSSILFLMLTTSKEETRLLLDENRTAGYFRH